MDYIPINPLAEPTKTEKIPEDYYEKNEVNPEVNLKFPKNTKSSLNENEDPQTYLNKKIELNEEVGIIKYIGPLKHKPNSDPKDIWLGIEWENKNRGKHNGTVENFEYFKTENNLNSGSLIRLNKANFGQDFLDALGYKYNFYDTDGNDFNKFVDKALETDNFITTSKKIINIELVGKEKAVREFSEFKRMICIDLTNSYISNLNTNINEILPKIQELSLTKSLLCNWSDMLFILNKFKRLTMLNFSENILKFDDEFEKNISKYINGEEKCYLNILVLNKCKIDYYSLIKLSPLFKTLEYLYLMGNDLNKENYENNSNKEFIDNNIKELQKNTQKLKYLSTEKNKIKQFLFTYNMFRSPELKYINLNQNLISNFFESNSIENMQIDKNELEILEEFKKSMTHISIDYNYFNSNDFLKIMVDIEQLEIKNLDILNNRFVDVNGKENTQINLVGRNPKMSIINGSTVTKIIRRDYEKFYLKKCVQDYVEKEQKTLGEKLTEKNFDKEKFEKYMNIFNKQYFVLKKKFFDPLDEFINLLSKNTNALSGNIIEVNLKYNDKIIKKKFPKNSTLTGIKLLIMRLFKMDKELEFNFYLKFKDENETKIEDESSTLLSLNLTEDHIILLK